MADIDEYINLAEAAEILDLSKMRVLQLIRAGELPSREKWGIHLINRKDLELVKERNPVGRPSKSKEKKPKKSKK
jgi:hypothetical protein